MDFLLNHGFEIVHLSVNTILLMWALAKRADTALLVHIRGELAKDFMTKQDGVRMERKLDAMLSRYKRNARERRSPQDSSSSL